ncbi:hypothetical protein K491DRAFT_202975 [Lophiostoma macrostomum CBS 122681]|uniref:Uncharacterized protein n=1 Tax=Lophiostoma macrostomum CBS 122681 TaxID=1314788 RepID=A0A6A6TJ19_9PLEO|nr:hypothetical protein K491DRAFT_202975 [Lophiostoma macrostomum CBS 122681]
MSREHAFSHPSHGQLPLSSSISVGQAVSAALQLNERAPRNRIQAPQERSQAPQPILPPQISRAFAPLQTGMNPHTHIGDRQRNVAPEVSLSIGPEFDEFLDDDGKPWIDTLINNYENLTMVRSSGKRKRSSSIGDQTEAKRVRWIQLQPRSNTRMPRTPRDDDYHSNEGRPRQFNARFIQAPSGANLNSCLPPIGHRFSDISPHPLLLPRKETPYISPYPPPPCTQESTWQPHNTASNQLHGQPEVHRSIEGNMSLPQPRFSNNGDAFDFRNERGNNQSHGWSRVARSIEGNTSLPQPRFLNNGDAFDFRNERDNNQSHGWSRVARSIEGSTSLPQPGPSNNVNPSNSWTERGN